MKRRVVIGASFGNFIEFYDFAIYGLAAVAISQAFFPSSDPAVGTLSTFAVYGVAFLARPLGGLFFGSLGDRIGRKAVLTISLTLIGITTACMGLLPTYDRIGTWAPALLVLLRLLQGFSVGGEGIGAPSFVLEHAPRRERARWINIAVAMSATPTVLAGGMFFLIDIGLTGQDYLDWGWRLPFVLAGPLSLIGLYIRQKTDESPVFETLKEGGESAATPIRSALRADKTRMFRVFCVMSVSALSFYFLVGYLVTYLEKSAELSRGVSLAVTSLAVLVFAILLPLGGVLSDRLGRLPLLRVGSVGMTVVAWPSFLLVASGEVVWAILGLVLLALPLCLYGGASYTFAVESFPSATRLSGAAVGYNLSYVVFGGTAPFAAEWLVTTTGYATSPAVLVVGAGALAACAAFSAPETAGRDLLGQGPVSGGHPAPR